MVWMFNPPAEDQLIQWVDKQLRLTVQAAEKTKSLVPTKVCVLEPTRKLKWITAVLKPKEILLSDFEGQNPPVFALSCARASNWQQRLLAASRLSCTGTMASPNGCFPSPRFTPWWLSGLPAGNKAASSPLGTNIQKHEFFLSPDCNYFPKMISRRKLWPVVVWLRLRKTQITD